MLLDRADLARIREAFSGLRDDPFLVDLQFAVDIAS
jgi:hypothetical protein